MKTWVGALALFLLVSTSGCLLLAAGAVEASKPGPAPPQPSAATTVDAPVAPSGTLEDAGPGGTTNL